MKTRAELIADLRRVTITQIAIQHHSEGVHKLFDAATLCANGRLSDEHREQLHNLLDQQLDAKAEVMAITRCLAELQGE